MPPMEFSDGHNLTLQYAIQGWHKKDIIRFEHVFDDVLNVCFSGKKDSVFFRLFILLKVSDKII